MQQLADVTAHLDFGASREALADDRAHRGVRRGCGSPKPVDLLRALDAAQGAHRRPGLDELGRVEHRAQAEREAGPHLVLERQPQGAGHDRLDQADRVVGLIPGHQVDLLGQLTELVACERLLEPRQERAPARRPRE